MFNSSIVRISRIHNLPNDFYFKESFSTPNYLLYFWISQTVKLLRTTVIHTITNPKQFKEQLLLWSQQFREVVFLESNEFSSKYSSYDCVLAVDAFTSIKTDYHNAFDALKQYQQTTRDWLFGYLSYDLKNDVEELQSEICSFRNIQKKIISFFSEKNVLKMTNLYRESIKKGTFPPFPVLDTFRSLSIWKQGVIKFKISQDNRGQT